MAARALFGSTQIATHDVCGTGRRLLDRVFELSNNHGRIFGPHWMSRAYVFIGAFSREAVDCCAGPGIGTRPSIRPATTLLAISIVRPCSNQPASWSWRTPLS
jgi:hypothetical protein